MCSIIIYIHARKLTVSIKFIDFIYIITIHYDLCYDYDTNIVYTYSINT